ncbi:hypothetical protein [Faecalibaculum rodentium]|uniref:hypothetical protein n=1 Tax=Faecalibaculum rodentium TaxID=1702221 RepID=UPI002573BACE|nr:hypothetical protein [Faecalibaculum rodentium]
MKNRTTEYNGTNRLCQPEKRVYFLAFATLCKMKTMSISSNTRFRNLWYPSFHVFMVGNTGETRQFPDLDGRSPCILRNARLSGLSEPAWEAAASLALSRVDSQTRGMAAGWLEETADGCLALQKQ